MGDAEGSRDTAVRGEYGPYCTEWSHGGTEGESWENPLDAGVSARKMARITIFIYQARGVAGVGGGGTERGTHYLLADMRGDTSPGSCGKGGSPCHASP